jgi:hypothetical protein
VSVAQSSSTCSNQPDRNSLKLQLHCGYLVVGARWGAFPGFVLELPVVPANVVGCRRVVGGATATASGLRTVAHSGQRVAVLCP